MILLVAAGLICFELLILLRREWGVYLIILLLPTYQIRFTVAGLPTTFLEGLTVLLATTEFVVLLWHKQLAKVWRELVLQVPWRSLLVGLFLIAAGVAVAVSPVHRQAAGIFKAYFFEPVIFYYLALLLIDDEKKIRRLERVLGWLVFYLSIFGIYQFVTLANLPPSWWAVNVASRRITSLVNHPNALALLLGPLLAFMIVRPKTKWSLLTISLGVVALYLSFSRAAWLAIFAAILLVGLLTAHRKKILAALLLVAVLVFALPYSRHNLLELESGRAATQENRYVLWGAAADMLKHSPILGVGLMGFHEKYKNYPLGPDRVVQNYPHDFFLNFWLETGLLGLLAMLGLLILFYKKIRQLLKSSWHNFVLAAGAAMTVIILHGLVDVPYFKNDLAVLFWLILALPFLPFLRNDQNPGSNNRNLDRE